MVEERKKNEVADPVFIHPFIVPKFITLYEFCFIKDVESGLEYSVRKREKHGKERFKRHKNIIKI